MFALRSPSIGNRLQCLRGLKLGVSDTHSKAGSVLIHSQNFHSPSYKRHRQKGGKSFSFRNKPGIGGASTLALNEKQMSNDTLITLGSLGGVNARKEILKRHIMMTDGISYDDACVILEKIDEKNSEFRYLINLPYKIGITLALTSAVASVPLVFDFNTVQWFNEAFVTADIPEPKDLETWLEVGSWSWNWMEPVMGQVSFALLCLQYTRNQLDNLGRKPYTSLVKDYRARRVADAFPRYCRETVMNYSQAVMLDCN